MLEETKEFRDAFRNYFHDRLDKPFRVALVGSSSLKEEFLTMSRDLELAGAVVLCTHVYSHADGYDDEITETDVDRLDKNGMLRIDVADCLIVLSKGRIGKHTLLEVKYAYETNKPIYIYDYYNESHKVQQDLSHQFLYTLGNLGLDIHDLKQVLKMN